MRVSFPLALTASLLLSGLASARHHRLHQMKRAANACTSSGVTPTTQFTPATQPITIYTKASENSSTISSITSSKISVEVASTQPTTSPESLETGTCEWHPEDNSPDVEIRAAAAQAANIALTTVVSVETLTIYDSTDNDMAFTGAGAGTGYHHTSTTWANTPSSSSISSSVAVSSTFAYTSVQYISASGTTSSRSTGTVSSVVASGTGTTSSSSILRGVNLGGWLVLEPWMNSDVFTGAFANAVDQWTFDSIDGASTALTQHWETWYTQDDINTLAESGINALRIPIGYWAYDNTGTPYLQGADAYLEKAIGWAQAKNMKVWIDCHGSPGSQNGEDHSGHAGSINWQTKSNLDLSTTILETIATKYGTAAYADTVVGIELTNEPAYAGNNQFSTTLSWTNSTFFAVKPLIENQNLQIIMHDAWASTSEWKSTAAGLNNGGNSFGIDTHLYQVFTPAQKALTNEQHISAACDYSATLSTGSALFPFFVGEWSAAANICVYSEGNTVAQPGDATSSCPSGSQGQTSNSSSWNEATKQETRKYIEAQLDTYEAHSSGYFFWSAKGPGAWSYLDMSAAGVFPNPITSRSFPGICS